eukprot:Skav218305  [mRNA]  locus=scaffold2388:175533:184350:+ [translate_table: standard]
MKTSKFLDTASKRRRAAAAVVLESKASDSASSRLLRHRRIEEAVVLEKDDEEEEIAKKEVLKEELDLDQDLKPAELEDEQEEVPEESDESESEEDDRRSAGAREQHWEQRRAESKVLVIDKIQEEAEAGPRGPHQVMRQKNPAETVGKLTVDFRRYIKDSASVNGAERLAAEEDDRSDIELEDDDDEKNEAEEYELWKIRELKRIKRDKEDRALGDWSRPECGDANRERVRRKHLMVSRSVMSSC